MSLYYPSIRLEMQKNTAKIKNHNKVWRNRCSNRISSRWGSSVHRYSMYHCQNIPRRNVLFQKRKITSRSQTV